MTVSVSAWSIQGILLDMEGTTTPIDFVYSVLFPFARARVAAYLAESVDSAAGASDLRRLKDEHGVDRAAGLDPLAWVETPAPAEAASAAAYVHWLMDRDRKSTGLKSLQGKIWEQGYRAGELAGQVFPDVPPALERWRRNGIAVHIFSSGSVLAQWLLFSSCPEGDLTRLLAGYFDTTTGPKTAAASYQQIAATTGIPAARLVFISDVVAELDAADAAGLRAVLATWPGNAPPPPGHHHLTIDSFDQIDDYGTLAS